MKPPIQFKTKRLILRAPVLDDAEDIFKAYAQDKAVVKHLTWMPHKHVENTREFLQNCVSDWKRERSFTWVILEGGSNTLLGMVGMVPEEYKVELGYVLRRDYWGKGIMTEAAQAIVDWAKQERSIYRIGAFCDTQNTASAHVLEKVGMQREGILRRWIRHPNISNEPRDCYCYSIVK